MVNRSMHGFTIVELIVIVVVISILAAIGVAAYNGTQDRARLQVVRSEMQNFAKAAAVFEQFSGKMPASADDFVHILKEANLYEITRTVEKSFAICASNDGYAFVAWSPLVTNIKRGGTLYLYQESSGAVIHTLTNSSLESNLQLSKVCDQVYNTSTYEVWTYDLP